MILLIIKYIINYIKYRINNDNRWHEDDGVETSTNKSIIKFKIRLMLNVLVVVSLK